MTELIPDYYGDVYSLRSSPWGAAVTFSVSSPKDGIEGRDVCVVRMSHETAKTLSMMIRKQLKQYERQTQTTVAVPSEVMNKLGLAIEDW
jgi:hypothetical protein